jgi:hypothetical protein
MGKPLMGRTVRARAPGRVRHQEGAIACAERNDFADRAEGAKPSSDGVPLHDYVDLAELFRAGAGPADRIIVLLPLQGPGHTHTKEIIKEISFQPPQITSPVARSTNRLMVKSSRPGCAVGRE